MRSGLRPVPGSTGALARPGAGLIRAAAALALIAPLAACDTISSFNPFDKSETYKPEIVPEVPAEQLYNDGLGYLAKNDYESASKRFASLDRQYPFSSWAKKALILQTFANYSNRQYDDAIANGKRFLALNPTSPDAAYAAYLVAMSYYNQIPDVSRDQERSEKALVALQEVVQRWPKSEYAEDARFKLNVVRDQLAGREMTIGRYYLQRRNYTAAINRFRNVVSQYQTTNQIEEALSRLTEAYLALGVVQEAETAAAVLGHNFPDSPWYRDTYKLMQSKGLEPRENEGSWISKAFKSVGLG